MLRGLFWLSAVLRKAISCESALDHMAMDVGEAAFEAVVVVAKAFVIQAEEMQDGGVKIIDGGGIDGSFPAELVSLAVVFGPGLHTCSGKDASEAAGVVIAT